MKVKKYNKKLQEFDKSKIEESIRLAAKDANEEIPEFMVKRIAQSVEDDLILADVSIVQAEDLAKTVENKLMASSYKEVAKSYITYHYEREKEHIYNSELIKAFKKKLSGKNIENSNANCDERSFSGRMKEAANILFKDEALNMMSKTARLNHINNISYTHDLDSYASGQHNCLSIPFDPLLLHGVITKQTDIRQPKSIQTACQLIAVIIQIQSLQQFGGVAATHIDWTLVPYVRYSFFKHLRDGHKYLCKDVFVIPDNCYELSIDDYKDDPAYEYALDLTIRDAKQGAEGLIHNLNSLQSRSGQQLPFSSINFGTCTLSEGRIMINAILDAELDGTGPLHKTPIFPCSIFQYHKDINGKPGTPNYDLFRKALYCSSKRLYPNYCNCGWSVNVNATNKDIAHKKAVLSKLSKENMVKLTEWVNKNKEIAINYRMKVENNEVIIDENILIPVEIMSTMGKCKLQLI